MDLPAWREENLAKRSEENDKKLRMSLCQVRERKKSLKNFWKVSLNKSNSVFNSLDRSKFWKKKHRFEKQPSFVHKFLQALKNMNKMHEYEMQSFSKTQVINPVFPKLSF